MSTLIVKSANFEQFDVGGEDRDQRIVIIHLKTFTAYIIYRKEWALKWAAFLVVTIGLAMVSSFYFKSEPLTTLFFALAIASFIFINIIMNYFTRKALIQLNTDKISVSTRKRTDDAEEQIKEYSLVDIASYQIQFPNSRFACLIFKFKSGKKHELSLRRNIHREVTVNTDSVIEHIHSFLEQHQIPFAPSFYASKRGLYTIIFLSLLLFSAFVIAINFNKNVPATLIGSILLVGQVISRRVNDLDFYKKWKHL